jgi:hypothetical protein
MVKNEYINKGIMRAECDGSNEREFNFHGSDGLYAFTRNMGKFISTQNC